MNSNRLVLIVLQVAIIGIIAVGVTQVIITTGIDLSSGSVIALAAVVAASLAQTSDSLTPMFPSLSTCRRRSLFSPGSASACSVG
ncbi:Galactoside transport system permease protein mglC [Raoultella terrigena]|uniref:Galactoside transport system permease protein mglC n=1 Tax=Raoultella terrigena TaxID=577 RepID=A0A3P8M505_RAOTE|nr:Galactoside transport system permease protein mglC [Raoultella terrigena]